MNLESLIASYTQQSAAKQQRLAEKLGKHTWTYDPAEGVLRVTKADGSVQEFPAQLLGTERQGVFRWSWADPAIHPSRAFVAGLLQKFGVQQKYSALTDEEVRVRPGGVGPEDLCKLASVLANAAFYFVAPTPGVTHYLLVLPDEDAADLN